MRTLALKSQKGGAGKSTLVVNLAVEAMNAGEKVRIIDTDPQGSSVAWGDARGIEPMVEATDAGRIVDALKRAKRDGITFAIIDSAPRASASLAGVLRAVDGVLVPVRPSAFDVATIEQSIRLVVAAGRPGWLVLNACPPRAPEVAETRDVITNRELERVPVEIGERRAFARAVATGRSVSEFDADSTAAIEIRALWKFLSRKLK